MDWFEAERVWQNSYGMERIDLQLIVGAPTVSEITGQVR